MAWDGVVPAALVFWKTSPVSAPTCRLCTIMCGSKGCLGALGVVVALLATLAARPELILPHKIHAAVRESPHRPRPQHYPAAPALPWCAGRC